MCLYFFLVYAFFLSSCTEHAIEAEAAEFPLTAQTYFCDSRSPLRDLPLPTRSRSSQFFHIRSPDFWPAPLLFQYVSSSKLKKWTDYFYRVSSYDNAVLAVVIKCVSLSLSHTRALWQKQTMHCGYFDTTQKCNHLSFLPLTVVGGRRPSVSNLRLKWLSPSKRADFGRFLLIVSQL